MNRTTENQTPLNQRITVSTKGLMDLCDCGRSTALRIGKDSGALVKIGKRSLWKVSAVMKYLDER